MKDPNRPAFVRSMFADQDQFESALRDRLVTPFLHRARRLVEEAAAAGVTLTITQASIPPMRMGALETIVEARHNRKTPITEIDAASHLARYPYLDIPVTIDFDQTKPIGWLHIEGDNLPPTPNFVFSLAIVVQPSDLAAAEIEPQTTPKVPYNGPYRLASVALLSDVRYIGYLKQTGVIPEDTKVRGE